MGQLTNLYVSESYQGLIKLTDSTSGVTGTLQYIQDGLGNRLPMQMSTSSVSITGSLHRTASYATQALSASWAPDNTDTGSYVTTSSFNAFTASIDGRVDALEVETGSLQNQINQKLTLLHSIHILHLMIVRLIHLLQQQEVTQQPVL